MGYGREWKLFGADTTGKGVCKMIPSRSVQTIFFNLCQALIQLPLSIALVFSNKVILALEIDLGTLDM